MVLVLAMLRFDCKSLREMRLAMGEEMQQDVWQKAIPEERDRLQSRVLVGVVVPVLAVGAVAVYLPWNAAPVIPLVGSATFAVVVWALRSATLPATAVGFLICSILARAPVVWTGFSPLPVDHPAIPALAVLFVLTFGATRLGRARKEERGVAEARSGRRASQIVANLGVAALCALVGWYHGCIAALAEATADTVSSEIGQAIGGRTWIITTLQQVPAGEDGGVSVAGTIAGVAAAGVVVAAGSVHHALWTDKALMFFAACAGLVFDSWLGATVERRGWVGNDLVNFASTLFAAMLPLVWLLAQKQNPFLI
jgi:uncharacterized protein (TIGR00297 family)